MPAASGRLSTHQPGLGGTATKHARREAHLTTLLAAPVAAMTAHLAILTLGFAMLAMFSRDSRRALPLRLESLMIVAAWLLGRGSAGGNS